MRILVAGDTHANVHHGGYLFVIATERNVDAIVQVGDFGYGTWAGNYEEWVARRAKQTGIPYYWLDGNHEDFDELSRAVDIEATVPQKMAPNFYYLPRGSTWEWDGVRFMAMGGAYSVDKDMRVEGRSWWPQETIKPSDIRRAEEQGEVDIMFTHDAPEDTCPLLIRFANDTGGSGWGIKNERASRQNRKMLEHVIASAKPRLLIHGHMHERYNANRDGMQVVGLGNDGQASDSWIIIDTDDWK